MASLNEASKQAKAQLLRTIVFGVYNGLAAVFGAEILFYILFDHWPQDKPVTELLSMFVMGFGIGFMNYLMIGKRWILHGKQGPSQGRQED